MKGLEPIRLATLAPKTSAYTNSATSAFFKIREAKIRKGKEQIMNIEH